MFYSNKKVFERLNKCSEKLINFVLMGSEFTFLYVGPLFRELS